jgi:hypothetical protein
MRAFILRVLFLFYVNDSAVECSRESVYSRENKLPVPVGKGKGERLKTFLNKTRRYGRNLDGNQLAILRKTIIIFSLWSYRYICISVFGNL